MSRSCSDIGSNSVPNSSLELEEYITEEKEVSEEGGPVSLVRAWEKSLLPTPEEKKNDSD